MMIRSTSIERRAPGVYRVRVNRRDIGWIERVKKSGQRCTWEISVVGFLGNPRRASFDACQAALIDAGIIEDDTTEAAA